MSIQQILIRIVWRIMAFSAMAGGAVLLTGCGPENSKDSRAEPPVRPVKISVVNIADNTGAKNFPGITEAARKSTLTFRVSGLVQELLVKAGQSLKKGDLIARLDERQYRNIVNDRQAKYDLAKAQFERRKHLMEKQHVSQSVVDEFKANLDAAAAALDTARQDLRHTMLKAPYSGIVAQVHIDNFQNIQAGAPVIELQGEKNINIVFNVPEYLFLEGQRKSADDIRFRVSFNSRPDLSFIAKYHKHDSIPDPATRSYRAVLKMPLPEKVHVLPGMSVTISVNHSDIYPDNETNHVLVPLEAVFNEAGKNYVWRVDKENISRRTVVRSGNIEGSSIRIIDGLKPGQRVIAAGVSQITEGLKVREYRKERGL